MLRLFQFSVLVLISDKIFALPNDIERCRIDDDKCLVKSSNKVLRKYYGGIQEIDLVPLDPFFVDHINIARDGGIVNVRATANNTNILGFSKAKIEKITGFDKDMPEINIKAAKLSFSGRYSSVANVLGIPINGNGKFTTMFNDFIGIYRLNLTRVQRNGKTYFKVNNLKLTFTIAGGELDIPDQGYLTNAFLNASFDLIVKRNLIEVISEAWAKFFKKTVANVLNKVAIEDMFLT